MHKILFVDDEEFFLVALRSYFEPRGFEVQETQSGDRAIEMIKKEPDGFAVVIVDYQMKGINGIETVSALRKINPDLNLLVFSGKGNDPKVLKSYLKVGPLEFLDKDGEDFHLLESAIKRMCLKYDRTTRPAVCCDPPSELSALYAEFPLIVGRSVALANVIRRIKKLQNTDSPVLVVGESGTETVEVARAFHTGPEDSIFFFDCFEHREKLYALHYELFGKETENLVGTVIDKQGAVECAEGGTIILANIQQIDFELQKKLLTLIVEKQFRRVRGAAPIKASHFRLVVTSSDLEQHTTQGNFLKELYQKFKKSTIEVPPLRERIEDLEPIVVQVCEDYHKNTGIKRTVQKRAIEHLERYSWPENVRELKSYIEELLDHSQSRQVTPSELASHFFMEEDTSFPPFDQLEKKITTMEREYFEKALRRWSFNKDRTAREINISPTGLRRKIASLGLSDLKGGLIANYLQIRGGN